MIRNIIWGYQMVTTTTDKQFEEQIALMEEVGITDYTVEELPDYEIPPDQSAGLPLSDYTPQEVADYLEEMIKRSGFVSSKIV